MSLVKTLAKVAIGVAVAKGASSMMRGGASGGGAGGGLGGLLGGLANAAGGAGGSSPFGGANSPTGGLQDMMGSILGGAQQSGGVGAGGLGGLLEQLGGAQAGGGAQGGLGGLLGGLAGAAGAGGAGGILGGLAGALAGKPQQSDRSFGEVLNSQFDQVNEPAIEPSADQEAAAGLMLRAMIQATKADGELDDAEKAKLIDQLGGDVDQQEAAFVQEELSRPVDINALAGATPKGMEPQIYAMSLLGIDLDSQAEAQYLHKLAQAMNLSPDTVNSIHKQLGVQSLYT